MREKSRIWAFAHVRRVWYNGRRLFFCRERRGAIRLKRRFVTFCLRKYTRRGEVKALRAACDETRKKLSTVRAQPRVRAWYVSLTAIRIRVLRMPVSQTRRRRARTRGRSGHPLPRSVLPCVGDLCPGNRLLVEGRAIAARCRGDSAPPPFEQSRESPGEERRASRSEDAASPGVPRCLSRSARACLRETQRFCSGRLSRSLRET